MPAAFGTLAVVANFVRITAAAITAKAPIEMKTIQKTLHPSSIAPVTVLVRSKRVMFAHVSFVVVKLPALAKFMKRPPKDTASAGVR